MNFENFENDNNISIKLLSIDRKIRLSFMIMFLWFFFISIVLGYIVFQDISTKKEIHSIKSDIEGLLKDREKIEKLSKNMEKSLSNIKLRITIIFYKIIAILFITSRTLENIENIYNITKSSWWDLFKAGSKYSDFNYENYCSNYTLNKYLY